MEKDPKAGQIRVRGKASGDGNVLTDSEIRIEVCQDDGTWITLRCCSVVITIAPQNIVTAMIAFELSCLDMEGVAVAGLKAPQSEQEIFQAGFRRGLAEGAGENGPHHVCMGRDNAQEKNQ